MARFAFCSDNPRIRGIMMTAAMNMALDTAAIAAQIFQSSQATSAPQNPLSRLVDTGGLSVFDIGR
jgi:ABC-type transport system substrate-binding protein